MDRGHVVRASEGGPADGRRRRGLRARFTGGRACATWRWCPIRAASIGPWPRGVKDIALFVAATESFSRANINRSIDQSLDDARAVIEGAAAGRRHACARTSRSRSAVPYEGRGQPPSRSRQWPQRLFELGRRRGRPGRHDRRGHAVRTSRALMDALLELAPVERWGMHFHDTRGMALANVLASLERGLTHFDSSAGGLGGCPFAGPGAAGNVATEDLVYLLDGLGIEHGVEPGQGPRGVALHRRTRSATR